jgi:hypothetical protein
MILGFTSHGAIRAPSIHSKFPRSDSDVLRLVSRTGLFCQATILDPFTVSTWGIHLVAGLEAKSRGSLSLLDPLAFL